MSEPMNDVSLIASPTGPLDLYPFESMTEDTDPEVWCHHLREPGRRAVCTARVPLVVHLPGVRLQTCCGPFWVARADEIRVQAGFRWDGATLAINDDAALMASLVHDIVCTRIPADGTSLAPAWTYPLPCYASRHWLYARILRAQGAPWWRCSYSYTALMAANWVVDACKE